MVQTRCRIRTPVGNFRKRSENIETKRQGKKHERQTCFILILQKFNKYYYRLTEMESFPLTYSRMVASYSNYRERSVSNQLSVKETSNTNKRSMHFCDTYRRGRQLYAMAS